MLKTSKHYMMLSKLSSGEYEHHQSKGELPKKIQEMMEFMISNNFFIGYHWNYDMIFFNDNKLING